MKFDEIWKRVKEATDIKILKELSEIIGIKQNALSNKKRRDQFDVEWAFKIELKYGISTKWIMTGKGEKRRGSGTEDPYAVKLAEWMEIKNGEDDRAKGHIEITIEEALPEFKKWFKKKRI